MKPIIATLTAGVLTLSACADGPKERVCNEAEANRLHNIVSYELLDNPDRQPRPSQPTSGTDLVKEVEIWTQMISADLFLYKKDYETACRECREIATKAAIDIE